MHRSLSVASALDQIDLGLCVCDERLELITFANGVAAAALADLGERDARVPDALRDALAPQPADQAANGFAARARVASPSGTAYEAKAKRVHQGVLVTIARAVADEPDAVARIAARRSLTPRETVVLRLVERGMRNRDIAQALDVTEATVKQHVGRVYSKLGVSHRSQLLAMLHDLAA